MYDIGRNNLYEKALLNLIRQYGPISRKKLQEYVHVRLATITALTKKLVDDGYIVENGNVNDKGLKKALLINKEHYRTIGMTITKDQLLCMVVDLTGSEIARLKYPISEKVTGTELVQLVKQIYGEIKEQYPTDAFLGIGISLSAAFDLARTTVVASDRHTNLIHVPLKSMLKEALGIPVFIETSNNAYMLSEKWFGQAKDVENAIYIEISESIATGIMLHNKVVRGMFGVEGELGHTIVERNGRICTCGNKGCLETVASERVLKDTLKKMIERGAPSLVTDICKGDRSAIDIRMIYKAASLGDKLCTTLLEDAADYIGFSVANLINLLGSGVVIFGGEGIERDSIYVKMIIEVVKRNLFLCNWIKQELPVKFFVSNNNAWGAALGAAALGLAHFYSNEQILSFGIL